MAHRESYSRQDTATKFPEVNSIYTWPQRPHSWGECRATARILILSDQHKVQVLPFTKRQDLSPLLSRSVFKTCEHKYRREKDSLVLTGGEAKERKYF